MEIIFIGTGNSFVDPERGMSCCAIRADDGYILVDAGSGSVHGCLQAGIGIADVRGVLLTHFHLDHVLDLAQLLWLRRLHRSALAAPLRLVGPGGTMRLFEAIGATFSHSLASHQSWTEVEEVPPGGRFEICGIHGEAFKSLHTDESLCYRVEREGRVAAFSGDSGPCDGLAAACREADAAVLECSFGGPSPVEVHMGPAECGRIGTMSGAKRLILTHLPDSTGPAALALNVREARYAGEVTVAQDFMEIEI